MNFFLFLVFSRIYTIFSYYNNGTSKYSLIFPGKQILDLYENFDDDVTYWTISNSVSGAKTVNCGGTKELGGYNTMNPNDYLIRTYKNLGTHDNIVLIVSFFYNDSWDNADKWELVLDGKSFGLSGIYWRNIDGQCPNRCGAGFPDLGIVRMLFQTTHSASTLTVQFINRCDEEPENECFGILQLSINTYNLGYSLPDKIVGYGPIVPSQATAAACYPNFGPAPCQPNPPYCKESDANGNCLLCNDYTYFFDGTTCQACPYFCITCVDQDTCMTPYCPTNRIIYWDKDCLPTCNSPLKFVDRNGAGTCLYPCLDTEYLFWDGTCQTASNCNFPLVRRRYKSKNFCDFPCATGQILSQNGTCLDSCDPPNQLKTRNGVQYCETTCNLPNYLYWNGSCLPNCRDPPLDFTTDSAVNYCNYPCDIPQFVFNSGSSIGTCCDTCDFPLTSYTEAFRQYCDTTCPEPNWAYWNGSCLTICDFPLNQTIPCGANVCQNLCVPPDYLYWNGSCLPTCTSPNYYTIDNSGYRYCNNPCFIPNYLYWNESCLPICNFPYKQRSQAGRYYCDFPCNSSEFLYENGTCLSYCKLPWKPDYYQGNYFCNFPCPSSQYAFDNGTCTTTCNSPMARKIWDNHNFCTFGCPDNFYLLFNGSCSPSCNFPLVPKPSGGKLYCIFPCKPPMSLSWNGSCTYFCQKPFVQRLVSGNYYCEYPCLPNQWLTYEGKCLDSCPSPMVTKIIASKKLCIPACKDDEIFSFNGTCIDPNTCILPYKITEVEGNKVCNFPCARNEYLYPDNTCRKECNQPWKVYPNYTANFYYCQKPCPEGQYLSDNASCFSTCNFPFVIKQVNRIDICHFQCRKPMVIENKNCICPEGYILNDDNTGCDRVDAIGNIIGATKSLGTVILSSAGVFLIGGASPTLIWGLVHLMQIFYYLVFMNVNYPESVTKFLRLFDLATMSFLPNPLDTWLGGQAYNSSAVIVANISLEKTHLYHELDSPPNFRNNNYSGTFLQSGGSFFQIWFLFVLVFVVVRMIFNRLTDRRSGAYKFFRKVNASFEWVALIRIWLSTLLRMCFSSFLQVLAMDFTSYRFGISSVLGLSTALFNIWFAAMAIIVVRGFNTKYDESKFLPLVENLREGTITRNYTLISIWKRILLSISIIVFYWVPALQTLIPLTLYMCSTIIIVVCRPFTTINENFNEFITEFGLLVIHIIIMIYAWDDISAYDYDEDYKEYLGNIIILICIFVLAIRFVNLLFGMVKSVVMIAYDGIRAAYTGIIRHKIESAIEKSTAQKYIQKRTRVKAVTYGIKKLKIKVTHGQSS